MNHELVFKGVLALGLAVEVWVHGIDYLFYQSFCIPIMASSFLEMMIGRNEHQLPNIPSGTIFINPICSALIMLLYLTSVFIKNCKVIRKNKIKMSKKRQLHLQDNLAYSPAQSPSVLADQDNALDLLFAENETRALDHNPVNTEEETKEPDQVLADTADETKAPVNKGNGWVRVINVKPVDNNGEGRDVFDTESSINWDSLKSFNNGENCKLKIPNMPAGVRTSNPNSVLAPNHPVEPYTNHNESPSENGATTPNHAAIPPQNLDTAPKSLSALKQSTPEGFGIVLGIITFAAVVGLATSISNEILARSLKSILFLLPSYWTVINQSCYNYSCRKVKNLIKSK